MQDRDVDDKSDDDRQNPPSGLVLADTSGPNHSQSNNNPNDGARDEEAGSGESEGDFADLHDFMIVDRKRGNTNPPPPIQQNNIPNHNNNNNNNNQPHFEPNINYDSGLVRRGRGTQPINPAPREKRSSKKHFKKIREWQQETWEKIKENRVTGFIWRYVSLFCGEMNEWRDFLNDRLSKYRRISRPVGEYDESPRRNRVPLFFLLIFIRTMIFIDSMFRGISQVVFADNPITGIIVFITLFVIHPWVGFNAFLSILASNLVAEMLDLNFLKYRQGIFGYNGYLIGGGFATFIATIDPDNHFTTWGVMLLSLFIGGLSTIALLSISSAVSPCFTLPANVLSFFVFLGCGLYTHFSMISDLSPQLPTQLGSDFTINGDIIYHGFFKGVGNIYYMDSAIGGIIVLIAEFIAYPLLPLFTLIGSAIGVLVAYLLGVPADEIASGAWGYNPALTSIALMTFYRFSLQSTVMIPVMSGLTVFFYAGIRSFLRVFGLPGMAFAWCFCSIMGVSLKGFVPELDENESFGELDLPRISNWKGKRDMRRVKRSLAALSTVEISTLASQQNWPQNRMRR